MHVAMLQTPPTSFVPIRLRATLATCYVCYALRLLRGHALRAEVCCRDLPGFEVSLQTVMLVYSLTISILFAFLLWSYTTYYKLNAIPEKGYCTHLYGQF